MDGVYILETDRSHLYQGMSVTDPQFGGSPMNFSRVVLLVMMLLPFTGAAQSAPGAAPTGVPTTKILAIGHVVAPLTAEQRKSILPKEVPDTVRLYLAGKID